jgi:hypothetical protein
MMGFRGGCLCGGIQFEIERQRLNAMHCHCSMCRKAHGTAFSTHVVAKIEQIRWIAGRDLLATYPSSEQGYRQFCRRCGSQIVAADQAGPGIVGIPIGTLEGDPPVRMLGHMYTSSKTSWAVIADDLPQYPEWPPGAGPASK